MALSRSKHVLRFSQNLLGKSQFLAFDNSLIHRTAWRTLFGHSVGRIDEHKRQMEETRRRMGPLKDEFMVRMQDYMKSGPNKLIFSEDLKTVLNVAENEEDVKISIDMLKRFQEQKQETSLTTFKFGPVVMRTLSLLSEPDIAEEIFKDPLCAELFKSYMTQVIFLNLMFTHERYQEVLDAMKSFESSGNSLSFDCVTLALGACCKLNTPESFQYASDLTKSAWKDRKMTQRSRLFFAKLALQQNKPAFAVEWLVMSHHWKRGEDHPEAVNLQILGYLKEGHLAEALEKIKLLAGVSVTENDSRPVRGKWIFREVLNTAKAAVEESGDDQMKEMWTVLEETLTRKNDVLEQGIDEFLFRTIIRVQRNNREFNPERQRGGRGQQSPERQSFGDDMSPELEGMLFKDKF